MKVVLISMVRVYVQKNGACITTKEYNREVHSPSTSNAISMGLHLLKKGSALAPGKGAPVLTVFK